MATEAQIAANRQNSQASTGPRTTEGKARSASNAVSLGLFTKHNCVQPGEHEEYLNLYNALWLDLSPVGALEEMFAIEVVRGAWRLRRCAMVEAALGAFAARGLKKIHQPQSEPTDGKDVPVPVPCDPMILDHSSAAQVAVDRARTQATNGVRRATTELRRLQTERLFRATMLPENADTSRLGLASVQQVLPKLQNEAKARLIAAVQCGTGASACPDTLPAEEQIKAKLEPYQPVETEEILKFAA